MVSSISEEIENIKDIILVLIGEQKMMDIFVLQLPEFAKGSKEFKDKIRNTKLANPRVWITNGIENKLHLKEEKIEDNWYLGRTIIKR
jgi:hypothetical protein